MIDAMKMQADAAIRVVIASMIGQAIAVIALLVMIVLDAVKCAVK